MAAAAAAVVDAATAAQAAVAAASAAAPADVGGRSGVGTLLSALGGGTDGVQVPLSFGSEGALSSRPPFCVAWATSAASIHVRGYQQCREMLLGSYTSYMSKV
jgi:hypothetical protein